MSKEMFIASSPHETKVAVLEDDELVEVYFERDVDVGLVGSIYKGRVSRVLPGMQSAFVDIGLERDAFLYVSDFYEDEEEYDKVFSDAEACAARFTEGVGASSAMPPASEGTAPPAASVAVESPPPESAAASTSLAPPAARGPSEPAPGAPPRAAGEPGEFRRPADRDRRRRRRGRGFGEHRFTPRPAFRDRPTERPGYEAPHPFEVLPGESLAKYGGAAAPVAAPPADEAPPAGAEPAADAVVSTPESVPTSGPDAFAAPELGAVPPAIPEAPPLAPAVEGESEAGSTVVGFCLPSLRQERESPDEISPFRAKISAVSSGEVAEAEAAEATESVVAYSPVGESTAIFSPSLRTPEAAAAEPPPTPFETESTDQTRPAVEAAPAEVETAPAPSLETSAATAEAPTIPEEHPPEEASAVPAASGEAAAAPPEQTYTLREPHRRPRFAPRHRRGRRGMGPRAPRPERHEPSRPGNHQPVQIADLLKEGQEILVQIAKEPLGTKGARITSHIALPGRYLVYMPTISHIGVSRKISSEEERLRLRNVILENRGPLAGGFIARTAAAGRSEEELKADLKFLSTLWTDIRTKAERAKAPALLHRDLNLVQRLLRDVLSPDFKSIRVDNELEYERVVEFVNRCQPSLVGHVKLYTRDTPIFEEFGIQGEIDKALKPKVWLKSGGYIVINQTEALVAIDVNTGKFVGKTNRLEDTIVKTNIDAVNEIVRQIRLRDLGGIIVIDFIDMDERRNRSKVVQALDEALRRDRAPTKILSFNDFGLVALTRKRVKQSLERTLCEPCNYCSGAGWIKSPTSVCYEILAEAKKMASEIQGDTLTLRVSPEVAHALKSRQGALLSELESLTRKDVIVKSDPTVHQERFEIY